MRPFAALGAAMAGGPPSNEGLTCARYSLAVSGATFPTVWGASSTAGPPGTLAQERGPSAVYTAPSQQTPNQSVTVAATWSQGAASTTFRVATAYPDAMHATPVATYPSSNGADAVTNIWQNAIAARGDHAYAVWTQTTTTTPHTAQLFLARGVWSASAGWTWSAPFVLTDTARLASSPLGRATSTPVLPTLPTIAMDAGDLEKVYVAFTGAQDTGGHKMISVLTVTGATSATPTVAEHDVWMGTLLPWYPQVVSPAPNAVFVAAQKSSDAGYQFVAVAGDTTQSGAGLLFQDWGTAQTPSGSSVQLLRYDTGPDAVRGVSDQSPDACPSGSTAVWGMCTPSPTTLKPLILVQGRQRLTTAPAGSASHRMCVTVEGDEATPLGTNRRMLLQCTDDLGAHWQPAPETPRVRFDRKFDEAVLAIDGAGNEAYAVTDSSSSPVIKVARRANGAARFGAEAAPPGQTNAVNTLYSSQPDLRFDAQGTLWLAYRSAGYVALDKTCDPSAQTWSGRVVVADSSLYESFGALALATDRPGVLARKNGGYSIVWHPLVP